MRNDFPVLDVEEFTNATGTPEFHSVQTIELGELIIDGVFTWDKVDWKDSAYSEEQYKRVCKAFEQRFWLREISITPVGAWLARLEYKFNYEICPKYNPLYAQLEKYNPLQKGGAYKKERKIESEFPETLLSENQDYASRGYDYEMEEVRMDDSLTNLAVEYALQFKSIDAMILDELEKFMFSNLYTTNVNGL